MLLSLPVLSKMGMGVVIRNHNDMCLLACSQVFDAVTSPELAEALAIRRALSLAREEGFFKIILAGFRPSLRDQQGT